MMQMKGFSGFKANLTSRRHKKDRFCGGLHLSLFSYYSSLSAAQDSSGLLESEIWYRLLIDLLR